MSEEHALKLRILSPEGLQSEIVCDGVQLLLPDDADGRGGGSLGIRSGHAPAVMALDAGPVTATRGEETVLRAQVSGGFASVADNVVTVLSDSVSIETE